MEKTKLYAVTLNPELFDYRVYDISEDDGNEVIIDGGRDYPNIDSKGYLAAIKKIIEEYDSYVYDYYYHGSIKEFLSDMMPKKENGKHLSPKEMHNVECVLKCYGKDYKETVICECLSVITGKIWKRRGLRGCCQGDYVEAYYPVQDGITKYLDWIEAWYFGTGTEVMIHDEDNEPKCAEEVIGHTFYTASWRIEDLKEEIRQNAGEKDDVEVILWLYDRTRTISIDEYKLAD